MLKPKECTGCPLEKSGTGFVCDKVAKDKPLFAVMFKHPGKMELVDNVPIAGHSLRSFQHLVLMPLKLNVEDLLLCNVLRCFPPDGKIPPGSEKLKAVLHCRRHGKELRAFGPTHTLITYEPFDLFKNPNIEKFLLGAFKIAKDMAEKGNRVLVLCGEFSKSVYHPNLYGGMKRWQRSFWKG